MYRLQVQFLSAAPFLFGTVAQLVEQKTFNLLVESSSLSSPTNFVRKPRKSTVENILDQMKEALDREDFLAAVELGEKLPFLNVEGHAHYPKANAYMAYAHRGLYAKNLEFRHLCKAVEHLCKTMPSMYKEGNKSRLEVSLRAIKESADQMERMMKIFLDY